MTNKTIPALPPCDDDVFKNGKSICLVDISKEAAEDICRNLSAATGCKVDWHYIGGRVHIKALATPVAERRPDAIIEGVMTSCGISHAIYASTVSLKHGEQVKLYASQPAPVSMVLPGYKCHSAGESREEDATVNEWNACLDKVKDLNAL